MARSAQTNVEREPLRIDVSAKPLGASLRLDIACIGRGVQEGEAFEEPERWVVRARANGDELQRLVNGPVRIERSPVGGARGTQWDITMRFSVVFKVPDATSSVDVLVAAPEADPVERRVRL